MIGLLLLAQVGPRDAPAPPLAYIAIVCVLAVCALIVGFRWINQDAKRERRQDDEPPDDPPSWRDFRKR